VKFLLETTMIALKSLRANKLRSILTILGVVIGIGTIIGMLSFINGINESVMEELKRLGPNVFYITRDKPGIRVGHGRDRPPEIELEEVEGIRRRVESLSGITMVAEDRSRVFFRTRRTGMMTIRGVQSDYAEVSKVDIADGRFFQRMEGRKSRVCILGSGVVEAIFGKLNPIGREVEIKGRKFKVIATLEESGQIFGSTFDEVAIVPYEWFNVLFGTGRDEYAMALPVEGADVFDTIEEVRLAMRAERRIALGKEDNFALSSQESVTDTFNQLTASIYWVMRIVASIALVVSGVGIMNIMLVVVMERTREIGLRKAVGAPRAAILGQFLVESIVLTLTGGIIGIGFGYLLRFLVAVGTPLPASVPVWAVPLAVGICCTIGVFFGFYPALKASGMDPVEALHYE